MVNFFFIGIFPVAELYFTLPILQRKQHYQGNSQCWDHICNQKLVLATVEVVKTTPLNDLYVTFGGDAGKSI